MCGICGIIGKPDKKYYEDVFRVMSHLYVETQTRGVHAIGYAALTSQGKMVTHKAPGKATDFVKTERWQGVRGKKFPPFFVGHCRQATHGNPKDNKNNHPFKSMNGRFSFVHNGVIRGHKSLAQQLGVNLKTECDSEVILRVIETEEEPLNGIQKTFKTIFSPMHRDGACVLVDEGGNCAYLFRNSMRPLQIIRIPEWNNAIVFASTQTILHTALQDALDGSEHEYFVNDSFQIRSGRIYTVQFDASDEPLIEHLDVPVKVYRTNDYFRKSLPAPARHRIASAGTSDSIIGFDDVPSTAPEECRCPCGHNEWVWKDEWKDCSICREYSLSPEKAPRPTDIGKDYNWIRLHCEECGLVWEQRFLQTTCTKCGSSWVSVTSVVNPVKKTKKASIWSCDKCHARFVGTSKPSRCYKCKSEKITWGGLLEGAELPQSWKNKKCHDCGKNISVDGPSRCGICVAKRKAKRKKKREEKRRLREEEKNDK